MKALAARRHHRAAPVVLLLLALLVTGGVYAVLAPSPAQAETASTADIETGKKLFQANCATCHGPNAEGTAEAPSLVGVGAAAVDFQVSTGRMPMQMNGPQAMAKPPQMDEEQTAALAAYVASLGAGPAIPTDEQVDPALGDPAHGMALFRTNCSMCHNAVGAGGALSEGKWAPPLTDVSPRNIYQAMLTGPQSMPVFNDANITPEDKRDIIAFLDEQRDGSAGGISLGSLGPVSEGLWAWVVGLGLLIAGAVWIGAKSS
ncbi:cystathionine beta-lyase [Xylanimonas oleitrophica]|uniref:Cytochrome bc1 complex cytochrome c subunit n=1 Tax=Xylanimonas oleitrophica TaxID=2607479 RepID=A0A2W5WRR1_9MICO|nr:cytochrome c [Xylanimonas oleitrophica]PZR53790.1 cystathionine beta-lyase [Xylanimonas oleitrophica]